MQLIFHTFDSLFRLGGIRESFQVKTFCEYLFRGKKQAFQVVNKKIPDKFCNTEFELFYEMQNLKKVFCREMEMSQIDGRMEGWLYTIRHNRFGLQFSRKRYFVLHDNNLTSFKSVPSDQNEVCLFHFLIT